MGPAVRRRGSGGARPARRWPPPPRARSTAWSSKRSPRWSSSARATSSSAMLGSSSDRRAGHRATSTTRFWTDRPMRPVLVPQRRLGGPDTRGTEAGPGVEAHPLAHRGTVDRDGEVGVDEEVRAERQLGTHAVAEVGHRRRPLPRRGLLSRAPPGIAAGTTPWPARVARTPRPRSASPHPRCGRPGARPSWSTVVPPGRRAGPVPRPRARWAGREAGPGRAGCARPGTRPPPRRRPRPRCR